MTACAVFVVVLNTVPDALARTQRIAEKEQSLAWYTASTNDAVIPFTSPHVKTDEETIAKDVDAAIRSVAQNSTSIGQVLGATARGTGPQDPDREGDVTLYVVQEGDTLGTIAQKNKVSINTLYWANEIDDVDDIAPGDTLFILPVSGLKHTVKDGEALSEIANEYDVDEADIIAFNELPANGEIMKGLEIVIPGGEKEIPQPEPVVPEPSTLVRRDYVTGNGGETAQVTRRAKGRKTGNRFPWGYCTYYVAQKRNVTWRGNAGAWLYNAKAQGYKTGKKPKKGSIVVTTDDAYYGHVAYVEKVKGNSIVVSEMNYKGFGVVNSRTIPLNSRSIRGYVY